MRHFHLFHPRDQIVAIMARIYQHDMTTTSGGNISVREANGDIWISPARVDKGRLRREDIVCLKSDGTVEGVHPPSSEAPFHRAIYRQRPDLGAIIHAHPGALVSFSMAGQVPDTRVFPETFALCGQPVLAPYALPGSEALGSEIARAFAQPEQPACVVLENHGVVVGGEDLATTFTAFEALEFAAATILHARSLGEEPRLLDEASLLSSARTMPELPEREDAEPASSREKEERKTICEFVHRAYEHRLMTSGWGSFSARVDATSFLITPRFVDRSALEVNDLVLVRNGTVPPGSRPSRAVRLHQTIYREHPEINAIVNALPLHASAFTLIDQPLDTRTIPESYVFLKDVGRLALADQKGEASRLAEKISVAKPAVLLEHNGVLVAGRSVLDAFDRMEIVESTAAAIIRCRALGTLRPMSNAMIRELEEAFGVV